MRTLLLKLGRIGQMRRASSAVDITALRHFLHSFVSTLPVEARLALGQRKQELDKTKKDASAAAAVNSAK